MDKNSLFEKLICMMPGLIGILDVKTGAYSFLSRSLEDFLGVSPEFIKRHKDQLFKEIIHPDDFPQFCDSFARLEKAGDDVSEQVECRISDAKNGWIWIRMHNRVFSRDNDGSLKEILGFVEKIDAQKSLEIQLKSSLEELEFQKWALDQAALVSVTDRAGVITYVNRKFCEISGYGHDELVGNSHNIIKSPVHSPSFFKELWETIAAGEIWRGEVCNQAKNGNLYWVDSTIVPHKGKNGRPDRYISIRYDITERKRQEELLNEQKNSLIFATKLAALGEMAAGIAHEIANPSTIISAYAKNSLKELTKDEPSCEKIAQNVGQIEHAVDRISKILENIRSFVRNDREVKKERISLVEATKSAIGMVSLRNNKKYVHLEFVEVNDPLWILASKVQIEQVIINVINNAFDALVDTKDPKVEVYFAKRQEFAEVRICDNGPGIPLAFRDKIMKPFVTTKPKGKGTGLGLSISTTIAKEHKGEFFLEPDLAKTCFVLRVPLMETV